MIVLSQSPDPNMPEPPYPLPTPITLPDPSVWTGFWLALLIMGLWAISLGVALSMPGSEWAWWSALLAVGIRTFLQTGLFIVAHDAMHGSLVPHWRWLNDRLGSVALVGYAGLCFRACHSQHQQHHRCTGTSSDPDFYPDGQNPVGWYLGFMRQYLSKGQLLRLIGLWVVTLAGLNLIVPLPWWDRILALFWFWILPLLLSSLQLFIFGTYLPHRQDQAGDHRIHSNQDPVWLSLLACYFFGYHQEHHRYPQVPWYQLPWVRWQI